MNREFENLDDERIDLEELEKIKKEPDNQLEDKKKIIEDQPVFKNRDIRRKRREKREHFNEPEPIYFENEFGKDVYPLELYAGFFRRFFAFLLDALIGGALGKIVIDTIFVIFRIDSSLVVYGLLKTLITLLYFTLSTYLNDGQTLGKMIFGLRVVSLDGNKLTLPQVLTREFFGRFIHTYGILIVLYILTAFTERKQNLSDLLADTSVIDLSKEKAYKIGKIDVEEYSY